MLTMSCRGISSLRSEIPDLGRYVENKKMIEYLIIFIILSILIIDPLLWSNLRHTRQIEKLVNDEFCLKCDAKLEADNMDEMVIFHGNKSKSYLSVTCQSCKTENFFTNQIPLERTNKDWDRTLNKNNT